MSFLLGSEYCIESLSSDIIDIQSSVKEILNKTGKINSVSWKFPDKNACDLNIDELVDTYKYDSNDIENNQVSHIILLELLIDRLSLLLQLNCENLDNLLKVSDNSHASNDRKSSGKMVSPCIGLVVKKHWNKFSNLPSIFDNMKHEIAQLKRQNKQLESDIVKCQSENSSKPNELVSLKADGILKDAQEWISSIETEQKVPHKVKRNVASTMISKDFGCKSSQTLETAFKPCESCYVSQTCLKEMSSLILKILQKDLSNTELSGKTQSAALSKLTHDFLNSDWLTNKQIYQIKDAIGRDLEKLLVICRKFKQDRDEMSDQVNELNSKIDEMNEWKLKFQKDQERANEELETEKTDLNKKLTKVTQELQETEKEHSRKKRDFAEEQKISQETIKEMKKEITKLKLSDDELGSVKSYVTKISSAKTVLTCIQQQYQEIEILKNNLKALEMQLSNQQQITENLSEMDSKVKSKQDQLMKRLQGVMEQKRQLEQDIDTIKIKLETNQSQLKQMTSKNKELENEKNELANSLARKTTEFQNKIESLQNQNSELITNISQLSQQNELLLNYPDLNGQLENNLDKNDDLSTGLKKQLETNSVRIRLLQEQNQSFQLALEKFHSTNQNSEPIKNDDLVLIEPPDDHSNNNHNSVIMNIRSNTLPMNHEYNTSRNTDTLPPHPLSPIKQLQLASSRCASSRNRRTITPATNQLIKQQGTNPNSSQQASLIHWSSVPSNSASSRSRPGNQQSFVCETCGRQYGQKTELHIHKDYCAGRRKKR